MSESATEKPKGV